MKPKNKTDPEQEQLAELITSLIAIKTRFKFDSETNNIIYKDVCELIDKTVKHVLTKHEKLNKM